MTGWWAADGLPPGVGGGMSTREGGVSRAPFDSFNLRPAGDGSGPRADPAQDDPAAIALNLQRLHAQIGAVPVFLRQVHGARCIELDARHRDEGARAARAARDGRDPLAWARLAPAGEADASVTTVPGLACTVLVADCLPVLLAAPDGRAVAAAHAGWRGLAGGVIEVAARACAQRAGCATDELIAWLGACIGPGAFEVGGEVVLALESVPGASVPPPAGAFRETPRPDGALRWHVDLAALARHRLQHVLGLATGRVSGGGACTVTEGSRFFSYRRDRVTGRMAAAVWIDPGSAVRSGG